MERNLHDSFPVLVVNVADLLPKENIRLASERPVQFPTRDGHLFFVRLWLHRLLGRLVTLVAKRRAFVARPDAVLPARRAPLRHDPCVRLPTILADLHSFPRVRLVPKMLVARLAVTSPLVREAGRATPDAPVVLTRPTLQLRPSLCPSSAKNCRST